VAGRVPEICYSRLALRRFAPFLPLPLVLALGAWGSARVADAAGAVLGEALAAVAAVIGTNDTSSDEESDVDDAIPASTFAVGDALRETGTDSVAAPGKKKAKSRASAAATERAIFVSAEKVLRLSETRVTPRGVRVPADGTRPAGLKLVGVGPLGIGLRDGDVLTRALGQPALSSSAVVRAVLVARARRIKVLEGEFYRGQERWILRVEQPYLEGKSDTLTGAAPGPRLRGP
jgi:hypothetical protein